MKQFEETALMAYIDGEADPRLAAEIESAARDDETLRATIASWRGIDAQMKAALAPAVLGPMPPLRVAPLLSRQTRPRSIAGVSWLTAMAAAIGLLMLGTGLGIGIAEYADYRAEKMLQARAASEHAQAQVAFAQALEKSPSGQTVAWSNPDSGAHGGITPVRTFKNTENQFCREFRQWQAGGAARENRVGIACREDGVWRVRAVVVDE